MSWELVWQVMALEAWTMLMVVLAVGAVKGKAPQ